MKNKDIHRGGFSYPRLLVGSLLCSLGMFLAFSAFGTSAGDANFQSTAAKIAPEVLADTANGNRASVVIFLAEQADVSAAYEIKDQDARGWFVYHTLTQHAERTQ